MAGGSCPAVLVAVALLFWWHLPCCSATPIVGRRGGALQASQCGSHIPSSTGACSRLYCHTAARAPGESSSRALKQGESWGVPRRVSHGRRSGWLS